MTEANGLLSARFTKHTGKVKSSRFIEQSIILNRPYAFLDRDNQRVLVREGVHREELLRIDHIEGLSAMISYQCQDTRVKAMLNHLCQMIRDSQVHPWSKVTKLSNDTLVRMATKEWGWQDHYQITQARNSHYMIQHNVIASEKMQPFMDYNLG